MSALMILNIIVSFVFLVVFTTFSFTHILQFQLNEYLFLRYRGYLNDVGFKKAIFPSKIQFPAKSIRNLLILGIVFLTLISYYALLLLNIRNETMLVPLFALGYFVAKLGVVLGVIITTPLATIMRNRLIYIAKRQLKESEVKIIAVTGSYGKSSVKEFLHRILSTKYLTGKTRGNHNTEVGIAIELGLQVRKNMKYFVAEMGAYTNGDIKKLCEMYRPELGVVTGIGNQHISLFGSQQNIITTKFEMIEGVSGNCYVNVDWDGSEEVIREYRKRLNDGTGHEKRIITYGTKEFADVTFKDLGFNDGFSKFGIHIKHNNIGITLRTKLIGAHNLINLIPAVLVAKELEVEDEKILNAVENIEPILGKLSMHTSEFGFKVLNDSYNSNLKGFIAALNTLKEMSSEKAKLYVSSLGIFELGTERISSYIQIINVLKRLNILLLTTDSLFKELDKEFSEDNEVVKLFKSEADILKYIKKKITRKDTLLLEGRHSPNFTAALGIRKAY